MQLSHSISIEQKQQQQLVLNAEMLQSLEILRMPLQELNDLVTQSIYENPLLEIDQSEHSSSEDFQPVPISELREEPPTEERPADAPLTVRVRDIWRTGEGGEGFDPALLGSEEVSFQDMLLEQIGALKLDDDFAGLCRYLVACLNRKGYLDTDPADIAAELSCALFDVMQGIYLIQSLQPAGVGARSLQECLILQLVESEHFNEHTIKLVKMGLDLLAARDIPAIAKLLGVNKKTAQATADIIQNLYPIPSQGYYTGEKDLSIIPDAIIKKEAGTLTITMNDTTVPRLELSHEYCNMLGNAGEESAKTYLQAKLGEAKQLIKAVGEREKTLVRILRHILVVQKDFFDDGITLLPMSMASVAEALSVSVSTISRAVQGKYIICAAGTVELKSMFTLGVSNQQGDLHSAQFIKMQLKKFIDAENPKKPLSDEHLRVALQVLNIDISRRTVAKYREAMGIASSSKRKRK